MKVQILRQVLYLPGGLPGGVKGVAGGRGVILAILAILTIQSGYRNIRGVREPAVCSSSVRQRCPGGQGASQGREVGHLCHRVHLGGVVHHLHRGLFCYPEMVEMGPYRIMIHHHHHLSWKNLCLLEEMRVMICCQVLCHHQRQRIILQHLQHHLEHPAVIMGSQRVT